MLDDHALLRAWQGGDERAGRTLVERHYDAVARFFATKDRANAADLIQLTLVKLIEARARVPGDCNVRAYALGIARHVLLDHFREMYKSGQQIDFEARSVADLQPTPSSVIARQQQTRLILLGLRRIPLESQILLELYYWEDLTAREMVLLLGAPEGTIRTRLRRARQLLEAALAELADSPELLQSTMSDLEAWARRAREELRPA
jgi:RNA polymerase sigma factor (sigma-70 family)